MPLRISNLAFLCQEDLQQWVARHDERIDNGYSTPAEPMLEVFGEQQPAPCLDGGSEDDRIPDADLVNCGEIDGR